MKINIQEDTLELLRKALSVTLDAEATDLKALDSLLSLTGKFKLVNGIHLLVTFVSKYNQLNKHLDLPLKLTWELLEDSYNSIIYSFMQTDRVELSSLTDEILVPSIPEQAERIAQILKKDLHNEFDTLYEYSLKSEQLLPVLFSLRESFQTDMCTHYLRLQATCLSEDVFVGRKRYRGKQGYVEIGQLALADIASLEDMADDLKMIRSADDERRYAGDETYETLFTMNMPPIDMIGGIMSNTINIIQAAPSIGKTTLLCYIASVAKMSGVLPAIYGGETREDKLWASIKSHDFYMETGLMVSWKYFRNPSKIEDEDLRTKVLIFNETYFQSKGSILNFDNINLSNFSNLVTKAYEEENIQLFLIDNVSSFKPGQVKINNPNSTSGKKEIVDNLSKQMIDLKKKYPIIFVVANWVKTRTVNYGDDNYTITAGLNQDADGLIEISNVEGLSESYKAFHIKKWRMDEKIQPLFLTETFYTCCEFKYNPEIQHLLEGSIQK